MACSKYEYVKKFQQVRTSLPQTYIVVRVDGRGFTKFCSAHDFVKPNDLRAIKLMNAAATYVCNNFTQIFLAYGQSDEYSFVLNKSTTLFSRRSDKILSCIVSAFTSSYIFNWNKYFNIPLQQIPSFDSRIIIYPNDECLKDYFRWRQVDCHINNLYNTVFWFMVKKGMGNQDVEKILKDTNSAKKNQILFSQFGINYNTIQQVYRRGTFLRYVMEKKEGDEVKEERGSQMDKKSKEEKPNEKKEEKEKIIEAEVESSLQAVNLQQKPQKKVKVVADKIRRKLVQTHQDCIKQQFWSIILK